MRILFGGDKCCQSRLETRAFDAWPFPLVGLADVRMSVLWFGGGQARPTLLVKRHGEDGHMVLSQATRSEARGACLHERNDYGHARVRHLYFMTLTAILHCKFGKSDAVKQPVQSSLE